MKKEDLLTLGLTDEQADKVMESLNGDFVTKSRFNEVNSELKAARASLAERDKQLEELKKVDAILTALDSLTKALTTKPTVATDTAPGKIDASVFQRGSINVLCANGAPKRGGAVYVRIVKNAAKPNAPVGGFEA